MKKNYIILTSFLLLTLLYVSACRTAIIQSCIVPPVTSITQDNSNLVSLSVTLSNLQVSAAIQAEFSSTLTENFDKISDSNATLFLFLEAIDCYLKQGKIGQDSANQMAILVREKWGAKNGLAGSTPTLSPLEKQLIQPSPESSNIFQLLNEFGIK